MALAIDGSTTAFITLPEAMKNANATNLDASSSGELDLFREAAQDVVEAIIGPVLWRQVTEVLPVTEGTYAYVTGGMASLTYAPVVSVQSVAVVGTPAVVQYALDKESGLLTGIQPWTWTFARNLTVSYTAGRTLCPSAVRAAALIICTHLWQTQLGNAPAGGGAFSEDARLDVAQFAAGYAIPSRAIELLTPYRTSTILIA